MKTIYMITTRTCSKCPFEKMQAEKFIAALKGVELQAVDAFEPGGVGEHLVREFNVKSTPTFIDTEVGIVGNYAYELKAYLETLDALVGVDPEPEQCSAAAKASEMEEEAEATEEQEQRSYDAPNEGKAVVHLLLEHGSEKSQDMKEKVLDRFRNEPLVELHVVYDTSNADEFTSLSEALHIDAYPALVLQRSNKFDSLDELEETLYSDPVFVCGHCGGVELTVVRQMKEAAPVKGFSKSGECEFDRYDIETQYAGEYYICKKCGKVISYDDIGKHLVRRILVPGSDKNLHTLTLDYRICTDGDFRLDGFEKFGAIPTEYATYEGRMEFVGSRRFYEARDFLRDLLCDGMSFSSARSYCMKDFYNMVEELIDQMFQEWDAAGENGRLQRPVRAGMYGNYDGTDFVLTDR